MGVGKGTYLRLTHHQHAVDTFYDDSFLAGDLRESHFEVLLKEPSPRRTAKIRRYISLRAHFSIFFFCFFPYAARTPEGFQCMLSRTAGLVALSSRRHFPSDSLDRT